MKTIEEILERHTNSDEWTSGFKEDVADAMKEYAEEYHLRQLKQNYKPAFCKGCKYWTVVDAFGGEYCRVLEKTVASPRDDYKHKDCPL